MNINMNNLYPEHLAFDLEGNYIPDQTPLSLEVPLNEVLKNFTIINLLASGHRINLTIYTTYEPLLETDIMLPTASYKTVYHKRNQQAVYLASRYKRITDPNFQTIYQYYLEDGKPNPPNNLLTGQYAALEEAYLEALNRFYLLANPQPSTPPLPVIPPQENLYDYVSTYTEYIKKYSTFNNQYQYQLTDRPKPNNEQLNLTVQSYEYIQPEISFNTFQDELDELTGLYPNLSTEQLERYWELYYQLGTTIHSRATNMVSQRLQDQSEDADLDHLLLDIHTLATATHYTYKPATFKVTTANHVPATEDSKYYDYYDYLLNVQTKTTKQPTTIVMDLGLDKPEPPQEYNIEYPETGASAFRNYIPQEILRLQAKANAKK